LGLEKNDCMVRKTLFISIIFSFAITLPTKSFAQDPEFTQFYANPLYLNPAFAGTKICPRVNMNYRNQWPGLTGTFVTNSVSFDQHVDAIKGGVGAMVMTDDAAKGTLRQTHISGIYSYELPVTRNFSIRAGFQATYFQKSLDWNKLTFGDQIDPRRGFIYSTNDLPRGGQVSNVDFSAGVLGISEHYFFGFAAHHLTQPNESVIQGDSRLPIKFTAHAGAKIPLGNQKYSTNDASISPNIMFRHQGTFMQLNMGLYFSKGPLVAGVWYRNNDAFITLIGIESGMFRFGYSYDLTVSRLTNNATAGSHELSLGIQFNCKPKRRRYRTISCPSF
jgi:type IX secretion system PorP/SprF family membrane protein